MILAHIKHSLRETFPGRASEWALALVLINWAVVIWLNPGVFQGASYKVLAQMADPETWGWLCLTAGGLRFIVLCINGAWRRSPHWRAFFAFVACFFWFQITLGMAQAGTGSTGLAVYPVLLFLDSYNVIRAMGEAGASDKTHKKRVAVNDYRT